MCGLMVFFFSSRRRHTRWNCDWSSDVCSSDLSKNAKDALDQMATGVKGQRGYIFEVQGFSTGKGQIAIENSQKMAESVVRYLVLTHEIPVYRIYLVGMGNAPAPTSDETTKGKHINGGRVEISLLKNDLE